MEITSSNIPLITKYNNSLQRPPDTKVLGLCDQRSTVAQGKILSSSPLPARAIQLPQAATNRPRLALNNLLGVMEALLPCQ